MVEKSSKEMAKIAVSALEEKKAKDLKLLDISDVSVLADYFIIASGSKKTYLRSCPDALPFCGACGNRIFHGRWAAAGNGQRKGE